MWLAMLALSANAQDVCFGEVEPVDLILHDAARHIRPALGGNWRVTVDFDAGADASARTIDSYFFMVYPETRGPFHLGFHPGGGADADEPLIVKVPYDDACDAYGHCSADVWLAPDRSTAERVEIRAGYHSPVLVRFVSEANTEQIIDGHKVVCEAESASDCTCYPCSTGPNLVGLHSIPIEPHVQAVLELQNIEHLHTGWLDQVPTL
jgi:hypothetical protein